MAEVIYSAAALADLERLASFANATNAGEAVEVVDLCLEAIELLARHPEIGRRAARRYRELVISRGRTGYLALYAFDARRGLARILRLRHPREAGYQR